ncbi:MAG: hypothetical protein JOY71_31865 [Acetobacteraceae bacterium]|nr:hypothetical protein [Acetobacteraceae bacterium]MBV8526660.1 hypothetical protein [Acetobacteraceae bacterium]
MKRSRPQEFVRVEDMDAAEPIAEGDGAGVNGERGNGCVQRDPGDLRSGVGIPDACGPVEGGVMMRPPLRENAASRTQSW